LKNSKVKRRVLKLSKVNRRFQEGEPLVPSSVLIMREENKVRGNRLDISAPYVERQNRLFRS
jgi:hypothetical protein